MPGKIIPQAPPTPDAASPPPVTMPGGPIEAAAARTAASTAEAAAAHSTMANPAGMAGGGVEVKVPGARMPTGQEPGQANTGPSFASNQVNAVGLLDTLRTQGAGDSLTNAPAETVTPATVGGRRASQDPEMAELSAAGGALHRAKHAMRVALKHLEKLGRKTRRAKKAGRRRRTEKKRTRK